MTACRFKKVFVILLLLCNHTFAQNKPLPVNEALKRVTKTFGVEFVYDKQLLDGKTTTYNLDNISTKSIEEVLKGILYQNNLVFLYVNKNYYTIVAKEKLGEKTAEISANASDQSIAVNQANNTANGKVRITGTVTDSAGAGVSDVTVVEKGTNNQTITGANGSFVINVAGKQSALIFSSVGYANKQVAVGNRSQVNILLDRIAANLDEVVVIGYGTQKKSDLTGSLARINAEQLNRNKTTDILNAMEGKIAGVQISSQSGELGSGFTIKVRGASSINGSSNPLFVIDGIPMDVNTNEVAGSSLSSSTTPNPLSNINPSDIESLEVLKDASATAIYGSRGANGVVLITTKSGKAGKSTIDYDGNVRFGSLYKKINVLSAQEYLALRLARGGATDALAMQMDTNGDGIIDVPGHDWQDEVYSNSVSQSHTLTASGGTKTTVFSGSLNYLHDQGIISVNTNDRYGIRLRLDHNVNDKLKVGFNINSSDNVLNGATNSGGSFTGVTRRVLFTRPVEIYSASDASDGYDTYISPLVDIFDSYKNVNTAKTLANTYLNYKIAKNLTLNITGGGTLSDSKGKEFYSSKTTGGIKINGLGIVQNIHSFNWTNSNQLTYQKQFSKGNTLNVIGVFEVSSYGYESSGINAENFTDQSTGIDDISKANTVVGISTYRWKNNRLSYISRANYTLANKYIFTGSIRADGSDKFGGNNKWGYFPSGAFAWKISEEGFMRHQNLFSNLKARLSYGITGNELIPPYSYLPLLENSYYASNGTPQIGLSATNPGNPNLKWEESTQYNAGLDIGILKDRVEITADVFQKQVKNMLIKAQLPTQSGYFYQWQNIGRVDNKGAEISVISHNIRKKDFTWDMDFNLTYNQSIVKSLGGATNLPITIPGDISALGQLIVGQPFGTGYGYVGDGVYQYTDFTWQNNSDPTIAPGSRQYVLNPGVPSFSGANVAPGSYKFKDISGPNGKPDGIINSSDQQVISHSQPKFTGGFSNTFHYKNFDFSFFLQGVAGRQIINSIKLDLTGWKAQRNLGSDFFYNRWSDTNPTNVYGTWSDQNATALYNSTFYVEDGSYLRLKSLTFAYNFRFKQTQNVISKLRVYATANDLFTLTHYSGYDPEVEYKNDLLTGVDALAYPRTRTFILGVSASF